MPSTPSIYRRRIRDAVEEQNPDKAVRALRAAKIAEQTRIENAIYGLVEVGIITREQYNLIMVEVERD